MKTDLKQLRQEASKLSQDELIRFNNWCVQLFEKRERESKSDDTQGIRPKDLVKEFRKTTGYTPQMATILWDIHGAALRFADFYEKVRVKGCRIDEEADMLLLQWAPASKKEFAFSLTRQVIPPADGEQEVWQLTVTLTFPISDQLRKIKAGNRWFRNLKEASNLSRFVLLSPFYDPLDEVKPSRAKLSYENVE